MIGARDDAVRGFTLHHEFVKPLKLPIDCVLRRIAPTGVQFD